MSHHTWGGGEVVRKNVTKKHRGIKNQSKKCHVLFEWSHTSKTYIQNLVLKMRQKPNENGLDHLLCCRGIFKSFLYRAIFIVPRMKQQTLVVLCVALTKKSPCTYFTSSVTKYWIYFYIEQIFPTLKKQSSQSFLRTLKKCKNYLHIWKKDVERLVIQQRVNLAKK